MAKKTGKKNSYNLGNNYAEKWTEETVLPILSKILDLALTEKAIYIGDALIQCDLYRDIWCVWKEKFADNENVFRTIKRIDTIFERYLFKKSLSNDINTTMAIFGLKNNHKWTDKNEVDITTKGNSINTVSDKLDSLTFDELYQLRYGTKPTD